MKYMYYLFSPKNFVISLVGAAIIGVTLVIPVRAAAPVVPEDTYYRATVIKILEDGTKDSDGTAHPYQTVELEITNGRERGRRITVDHGSTFVIEESQKVHPGERVIVSMPYAPGGRSDFYYITDQYRLPRIAVLGLIFIGLAGLFGSRRGLTSLFGLGFSLLIIFGLMIPQIIAGHDPLLVCAGSAVIITVVSLYLAHGFNRRTTIALISTLICLGLAVIIDLAWVHIVGLTGTGTEEAFYLHIDQGTINLRGILLGGIIIGVLGVLDDVTTGQTAAVDEIHKANPSLGWRELYRRGLSVGREHIASLINTLVLAYVGASFPLFLLFSMQKNQAWWLTLNSTFIAEEIVRTLVGSSVLIIAVPVATALSAYWLRRPGIPTPMLETTPPPDLHRRSELLRDLYQPPT